MISRFMSTFYSYGLIIVTMYTIERFSRIKAIKTKKGYFVRNTKDAAINNFFPRTIEKNPFWIISSSRNKLSKTPHYFFILTSSLFFKISPAIFIIKKGIKTITKKTVNAIMKEKYWYDYTIDEFWSCNIE